MKNIRLFIKEKNFKQLQALSDESYLYNYIVNNYTELPEDNIFRNPNTLIKLGEMIYFSKSGIEDDDVIVWNETSNDLKNKQVSYYAVILDTDNGSFMVYNNLDGRIPELGIDKNTELYMAISKIEKFNKEMEYEEEMEM